MADIFLTYSKQHAALTESLARDLEAAGYTSWWDTRLLPEEGGLPERIRTQIAAAKTVIAIWAEHSAGSPWVRAEANEGYIQGKLLQVRDKALDPRKVPAPFASGKILDLNQREKVLQALAMPGSRTLPPRGMDYLYHLELEFEEAMKGCKKRVQLDGGQIDVTIPRGIRTGQVLRLKHKGGPGSSGPGDVLIKLAVRPMTVSGRGLDFQYELELDFLEWMNGCVKELRLIGNELVKIKIQPGMESGQILRLKHKGGPGASEPGDALVTIKVRPKTA